MSAQSPTPIDGQPDEETYRVFLTREWADLHHSRIQEWSALGVVAALHVGLIHLMGMGNDFPSRVSFGVIAAFACGVGVLFAIAGSLVTCRHKRLMEVKLRWIYRTEQFLGLVKRNEDKDSKGIIDENKALEIPVSWNGLSWPRAFSTGWLMILVYVLLAVCDVIAAIFFLRAGGI